MNSESKRKTKTKSDVHVKGSVGSSAGMDWAYLIIFLLCLSGVAASAQEQAGCDRETLKTLPGNWLPQPNDEVLTGTPRPSATDIAGAKKIFDQIGQMFQEQYKPVGADVYNYLTHNISPNNSGYGNGYIYTISNFLFYCSNGKKSRNSEGVSSQVHVNPVRTSRAEFSEMPIYNENGEVSSTVTDNGGFHSFSSRECKGGKLPDLSSGYYSYEDGNDYIVWITYEGKQPYRYVSRKEFLEKQVAISEAKLSERNKYYSSKAWKEQFEAFPQFREKMLEGKKNDLSIYEMPLEAYRQDLKKDESWLNETAVVKRENVSGVYRFVFTTVNDGYMSVPIMPNPGYYNRSLPKWAPQFMVIAVGRTDGFIGMNVRKIVNNNIEYFKSLLAKQ